MHAVLACAAPAEPLLEMDYFAEQPVVLSASRLSQPVSRAPAAVTVITREMIEASGFRHLVDVLRLVPGFVVGWSGGNMPAASYLGLSNEFPHWMQIMVDGRSIYNPAYGHTTWRGIPLTLDDVDRIEVVRGPNSANDGLNSMLGTVHIFTRHSDMTLGGMGEVALGDKQFRETNLRYGAETSSGSWRLGLLGREDERHGLAQDHASDLQLSFRGDFQPTLKDDVMLQFGASKGLWQGTNVGQFLYDAQLTQYLSGFANLRWKRALREGREWSLQVHHTFNRNEENIPLPAPLDPLSGDYTTTGSGIQFTYLDQSGSRLRTRFSGEYRVNRVRLPALLGSEEYLKDDISRLSGAAEWSPSPKWVLHAGTMLERHSDTGGTYFSPRLALNWLSSGEHSFRLGYSQGRSGSVAWNTSCGGVQPHTAGWCCPNPGFLPLPIRKRMTTLGPFHGTPFLFWLPIRLRESTSASAITTPANFIGMLTANTPANTTAWICAWPKTGKPSTAGSRRLWCCKAYSAMSSKASERICIRSSILSGAAISV